MVFYYVDFICVGLRLGRKFGQWYKKNTDSAKMGMLKMRTTSPAQGGKNQRTKSQQDP